VRVRNLERPTRVHTRLLRQVALSALELLPPRVQSAPEPRRHEVTFHLAGDTRMASLNETHLGHPGPTDVITFDYGDPLPARGPAVGGLRGDVFIGVEVARRQAREFQTDWTAEVVRYVVHGLLHLDGYDDREPAARCAMKRVENRLVRVLAGRFDFSQLGRPLRLES
jgi:probable rRNA maturation factor